MEDRLSLGTVQFGLSYGIANKRGKIPQDEVFEILDRAYEKGVRALDTAYSYGDSEPVIGKFMKMSGKEFNVISKTPHFGKGYTDEISGYCGRTLENLGQESLYGYLVHNVNDLYEHREIWEALEGLKRSGKVKKIGVSVYKPAELDYLLDNKIRPDILQVPYNILDQRFEERFEDLRSMGIEVHARSIFLQGLFFLPPQEVNGFFEPVREKLNAIRDISRDHNIPVNALCLCFVLLQKAISKVIVGVDSRAQFGDNCRAKDHLAKVENMHGLLRSLRSDNEKILLPYNWK